MLALPLCGGTASNGKAMGKYLENGWVAGRQWESNGKAIGMHLGARDAMEKQPGAQESNGRAIGDQLATNWIPIGYQLASTFELGRAF